MGSSLSYFQGSPEDYTVVVNNQVENVEIATTKDIDPTERALKMIDNQKLTPCKILAQEVIDCVKGNHGEVANCIPPIKLYEQCVQDITYERIRRQDYKLCDVNSWKI